MLAVGSHPNRESNTSSVMRVVHSADDKLCSACHRSAEDDNTFVPLSPGRVQRASDIVDEFRQIGKLPPTLVKDFRPSDGCLCRRANYFYAFLGDHDKSEAIKKCSTARKLAPSRATRDFTRWVRKTAKAGRWVQRRTYVAGVATDASTSGKAPAEMLPRHLVKHLAAYRMPLYRVCRLIRRQIDCAPGWKQPSVTARFYSWRT